MKFVDIKVEERWNQHLLPKRDRQPPVRVICDEHPELDYEDTTSLPEEVWIGCLAEHIRTVWRRKRLKRYHVFYSPAWKRGFRKKCEVPQVSRFYRLRFIVLTDKEWDGLSGDRKRRKKLMEVMGR